jgi:hypothetical protein|tara:strand:+ start:256 stop:459 length:204 start_codon:yes stop_codon:yes gene_type:complete
MRLRSYLTNKKEVKEAQGEIEEQEALKGLNVVIEDLVEANELTEDLEEIEVAEVEVKAINQIYKAGD